ncbi:OmpP1/FadL family transporter [Marinobacter sp.]|uniref:OmpP1/FadL family transporter n=1 Tax=Marinobacter sp. TaxID=50741 RepID=UPI0019E54351|nr:outer membrane protein transport protein [Marinobacter sp.]MBE0484710.1 outer membrane protein transport protein [Marinobacter sp.]
MHKNTNALVKAIRLATLAVVAAPASVLAGGFALNEQSASAMGTANAGAAANPENASIVFFNPAGMSQLSGTNISFGATYLNIDAKAKEGAAATRISGNPVNPAGRGGDIASGAWLPNFYLAHEVNDFIDVGFGVHAPYGLAADYEDDFVGRFFADKTELTAIAFTPSVALNNGQGLSMGLGLNVIYAEGRLTRNQDLGPQGEMLGSEPYADIEGDDVAVTFRVGFLYELSEKTQFGLTAQTGTELNLKGDMEVSGLPPQLGMGDTLAEKVEVPLAIPESVSVGVRHNVTDDVTLLAGATYSRWSRFEELDIISRDPNGDIAGVPGAVISHTTEKWDNTWQLNVGGIWQATPAWAFKAGYAYDESPVGEYVTARIPSTDRHWLTLGAQWKDAQSGWTVDAAIGTLIFDGNAKVDEVFYQHENPTEQDPVFGDSRYQAEYELSAWSAAIEFSKAF